MKNITATFRGKKEDLEMFLFCGVKNYSTKKLNGSLKITWIDTDMETVLDSIILEKLEMFNCTLASLK